MKLIHLISAARTLQELSDLVSTTRGTLEQYELSCKERGLEITNLKLQKIRLEAHVDDFQNNNEEYLKIIKSVGEEVLSILSNVKVFLRCALLSITESIRNNPERYRSIFYNMTSITDYSSSSNGQDYSASFMDGQQRQQNSSPDYDTEANAAMIVDEAEKLFYKLIKDYVNKTIKDLPTKIISEAASSSESSSLSLPRPAPAADNKRIRS